jgi:hypothetical protein
VVALVAANEKNRAEPTEHVVTHVRQRQAVVSIQLSVVSVDGVPSNAQRAGTQTARR